MAADTASLRMAVRASVLAALFGLGQTHPGLAFPTLDPSDAAQSDSTGAGTTGSGTTGSGTTGSNTESNVPAGTELGGPALLDLQHQLQLANGLTPPVGGGWTILPRIDLEEMFNDNVFQANSPRRWDIATFISPGIFIAGDLPRAQLSLDYAPTLQYYARTPEENALTGSLTGSAHVTLDPDLVFVDLHAFSGVIANNGLIGTAGTGTIGQVGGAGVPTNNTQGLANANRSQTASFQVSPYLQSTFGDYGTAKIGANAGVTTYATTTGFVSPPFPTGGGSGTTMYGTEEFAQYSTGNYLERLSSTLFLDLIQTSSTSNELVNATTGAVTPVATNNVTSSHATITDTVNYAVNRWAQVFVSFGHENIQYTPTTVAPIDDFTWSVGATVIPKPDSQITVSYGHQNGFNSAQASVSYQATARTLITGGYSSTLGTALEEFGQQVQGIETNPTTGQPVVGTNGQPLLLSVLEQGNVQTVYRYNTLTLNATTTLNRDIVTLSLALGTQTSASTTSSTNTFETGTLQWVHELQPDLLLNTALSYSVQNFSGTTNCGIALVGQCPNNTAGVTSTLAIGSSLQYTLTPTLSAHLRYLFYDRNSPVAADRMYQDLVVIGLTKTF